VRGCALCRGGRLEGGEGVELVRGAGCERKTGSFCCPMAGSSFGMVVRVEGLGLVIRLLICWVILMRPAS
jgi:hypothetical protein